MKYAFLAAAALFAAETAAIACSCLYTEDPAEVQQLAVDVSMSAVALVQVEALTSYEATGQGERMKVVQLVAGTAPAIFQIERGHVPSDASCDILYGVGQRDWVLLYPAQSGGTSTYRTSGLCMAQFLDQPAFRQAVASHIGAAGERG